MKTEYLIIVLFLVYLAVLIKLIVFKYPPGMVFDAAVGNYVPFKTIFVYLTGEPTRMIAIRNFAGNIVPFIPLGFFVPLLSGTRRWSIVLASAVAISVVIEVTQSLFRVGIFDIDDVLLNVFGVVIGHALFLVFIKIRQRFVRTE